MPPFAYHFSVDDAFECLWENSDCWSVRSAPTGIQYFEFFEHLHRQFDADIDVYVFLHHEVAGREVSLADIATSRAEWFQKRPWLRFAPHAFDRTTPPYAQPPAEAFSFYASTARHIDRIAGLNRHSRWVRLHYFSECYELAPCLRSHGVEALLTTDKPAASYRLPVEETAQLKKFGVAEYAGIHFVQSHIRIENLVERSLDNDQLDSELDALCANSSCAVILTHEYELIRPEVREMTDRVFSWIQRRQLKSVSDSKVRSRLKGEPGVRI